MNVSIPERNLEFFQSLGPLVDVSDIFYFFFSGAGEREEVFDGDGQGSRFQFKIEGGGLSEEEAGGGEGRWGNVCGEGGGAKYFFSGPKFPPSSEIEK